MIIRNYLVIVFFLFVGCNDCNLDKYSLSMDHLRIEYEREGFKNLLATGDGSYLFGTNGDHNNYANISTSVYYNSEKDNSKWRFLYSVLGENYLAVNADRYIYLINNQRAKPDDFHSSNYTLIKISKQSNDICEVYEFKDNYVKSINFVNDSIGFALINKTGHARDNYLIKTADYGNTWMELSRIDMYCGKPKWFDGELYFITNSDEMLMKSDIEGGAIDTLLIGTEITDFSISDESEFWTVEKQEERILLNHYDQKSLSSSELIIDNTSSFVKELYTYNEIICAVISTKDNSLFGGLGGTKDHLQLSFDKGKNWCVERKSSVTSIKPISFSKDIIKAYVYNGRILEIDIK